MTGDAATFEKELILDGLQLSLIGMGVVFGVLALLALSIKAFDRIDVMISANGGESTATATRAAERPVEPPRAAVAEAAPAPTDDAELAAAIAVALALADSEQARPAYAMSSAAPRQQTGGSWLMGGRQRQMSDRITGAPGRNRGGR